MSGIFWLTVWESNIFRKNVMSFQRKTATGRERRRHDYRRSSSLHELERRGMCDRYNRWNRLLGPYTRVQNWSTYYDREQRPTTGSSEVLWGRRTATESDELRLGSPYCVRWHRRMIYDME